MSIEQVDDTHYSKNDYQTWDYILDNNLSFLEGNVIKYLSRYNQKGTPMSDLNKALTYLLKSMEIEEPRKIGIFFKPRKRRINITSLNKFISQFEDEEQRELIIAYMYSLKTKDTQYFYTLLNDAIYKGK